MIMIAINCSERELVQFLGTVNARVQLIACKFYGFIMQISYFQALKHCGRLILSIYCFLKVLGVRRNLGCMLLLLDIAAMIFFLRVIRDYL